MNFAPPQDVIHIREITLDTVIGVYPGELDQKQPVIVSADLFGDFSAACASDDFQDAADYRAAEQFIISCVENASFKLLEALAQSVANGLLSIPKVQSVAVRISKPHASLRAKSIELEIFRSRETQQK